MDFFQWEVVKEQVYQSQFHNVEHLKNMIRDACRSVTSKILINVERLF